MKWIIRIYSVVLLAYTGWRTFDFMSSQLPKTDISFWLSIAFLFATEIGLILWHETNLNHVTTDQQNKITLGMTWVDFFGSLAAGIADMILRQTFIDGFQISPALAQFLMYGLPSIMALNVGAVILFEQNDAEVQEEKAEKSLRFEIHRAAMKELKKDREVISEEKKAAIYSKMRASVTGRIDRRYGQPAAYPETSRKNKRPTLLGRLARRGAAWLSDKTDAILGDNDALRHISEPIPEIVERSKQNGAGGSVSFNANTSAIGDSPDPTQPR